MSDGEVIGTIALMMKQNKCAVMKKFFVKKEFRSQKIGLALYNMLIEYTKEKYIEHIILDTPSVAAASHRFYEKAGFKRIESQELPVPYGFPDSENVVSVIAVGYRGQEPPERPKRKEIEVVAKFI